MLSQQDGRGQPKPLLEVPPELELQTPGRMVSCRTGSRHPVDSNLSFLNPLAACPNPKQDGQGSVTAGNASPMTDGAAALVLASRAKAQELGLPVLAVVRAHADANQAPEW